ncbi:hypothetical protein IFM89_029293 [Coptis chinensis]|uniref:Uncharacterized protein n=1 Tax=Coptis chinensis TaxID=261450 RepID=A0A835M129_9MAGN|nr:hypothetical protein IFM89_029293 [Coptis chinensis]
MGKILCDSTTTIQASPPPTALALAPAPAPAALPWKETTTCPWETVSGLEDQQKRYLQRLHTKGVLWKHPATADNSPCLTPRTTLFRLLHGGDVEADGNCLFTASKKAMGLVIDARELRRRTVDRFLKDYGSGNEEEGLDTEMIDKAIKHLYSPDLKTGWGIHVVQEVKLLAKKTDRVSLDLAINELVDLGMQREMATESIYKERCIEVDDGPSWVKYMSISGSVADEYDIITLQYTEEGLLSVDENRQGHAAAFGDDIAIESLATEFKREIYVVQAHGSDAMVEEENCVFFLPHFPRSQICGPPFFLFMKGTGWCGAGADHYEPLIAHPAPLLSQEKAAVVL